MHFPKVFLVFCVKYDLGSQNTSLFTLYAAFSLIIDHYMSQSMPSVPVVSEKLHVVSAHFNMVILIAISDQQNNTLLLEQNFVSWISLYNNETEY